LLLDHTITFARWQVGRGARFAVTGNTCLTCD